jgi:hypothetical protein
MTTAVRAAIPFKRLEATTTRLSQPSRRGYSNRVDKARCKPASSPPRRRCRLSALRGSGFQRFGDLRDAAALVPGHGEVIVTGRERLIG